jgi:exopolysaccharide biosynthesis protein
MDKLSKKQQLLIGFLSALFSIFLVGIVVYGATTIGTNITTTGTASSTSATTTAYLYVGQDVTEPAGWDFSGGDLIVSGAAYFAAKATSSMAFAVGAGTINSLDMADGDLYVQDDVEVDGWASTTSALNTQGTLNVGGNAKIGGMTTTSDYIYLPLIKFNPSATPTPEVRGQCFMDNSDYQLNCFDGSAWKYLW